MADVVALGDVNVDVVAQYDAFPAAGKDAFAHSTEFHCGGSAANTAMALAWLGIKTALVSRVGADPWGSIALKNLNEAGVQLGGLQRDPMVMTGHMYIVVTADGERTILGHRGANVLTDPGQISAKQIQHARLFHLSGYALLAEPQRSAARLALDVALRHGLAVSLDPGTCVSRRVVHEIRARLPSINLLLPNLVEAQALTGRTEPDACAQALLSEGVSVVVIKLGRDGCLLGTGDGLFRAPGFAIQARDSTGAGDSFAAAWIAAFLGDLDWPSAAVLANAMGASAAACVGAGAVATQGRAALRLLRQASRMPVQRQYRALLDRATGFLASSLDLEEEKP
jgi:ribokinase